MILGPHTLLILGGLGLTLAVAKKKTTVATPPAATPTPTGPTYPTGAFGASGVAGALTKPRKSNLPVLSTFRPGA